MPPPVPARVKLGRMMTGRPTWSSASRASAVVLISWLFGESRPIRSIAWRNRSRSSALSMTSALAPIISTPNRSRVPSLASAIAVLSAVCPPIVGSSASGRTRSITRATIAGVIGST